MGRLAQASVALHPAAKALGKALAASPFADHTWLVGGAVRDAVLGRPRDGDCDFVTDLSLDELLAWLEANGWPVAARYPRFGTAMLQRDGATLELVQARTESYSRSSRKPDVRAASLVDDLRRRDFTVNTLIQDLRGGKVHDLLGIGFDDLEAKLLRTPLDPIATFEDDPLRMLRAVRFRAELGFAYAPDLPDAIRASADRLAIVSAERIRDEWVRMILSDRAGDALRDLAELGLVRFVAPELLEGVGVSQGDHHHLDVFDHTLAVLDASPGDLTVRLAAVFHDVAKPRCKTVEAGGRIRFIGHERVGAEMANERLRALRFSEAQVTRASKLVRNHMRLGSAHPFSHAAARRLLRDLGEDVLRLLDLVSADIQGHGPGAPMVSLEDVHKVLAEVQVQTPVKLLVSPLDGRAIQEVLGIEAGPAVGKAKRFLEEAVLDGALAPGDVAAARGLLRAQFINDGVLYDET